MLWGETVQETVTLRPWGEQITDGAGSNGEVVAVDEPKDQAEERWDGLHTRKTL